MGETLREARLAQGLSIQALADKIREKFKTEIGTSTIRQTEKGLADNPGIKTIELICRGLDLSVLEILALGLEDPPPEQRQRFSQSRFAIMAEMYEASPPERKILYDEYLEMLIERMRSRG